MAFTLAHPAAVLPFARTKLIFSALVVGALAPDIGFFLTFSSHHAESHNLNGLFLVCLPAGLVMLLLFHKLLKKPLFALLPASHQARVQPYAGTFRFTPAKRFALIVLSLLVGSFTHLVWDSFTHNYGLAVRRFDVLRAPVLVPDHGMPLFKFLQLSSTVAGLVIVAIAYILWFRRAEKTELKFPKLPGGAKLAIAGMMVMGACVAALLNAASPIFSRVTFHGNVVQGGVTFVSAFVAEAIVFSVLWHFSQRTTRSFAHDEQ